MCQKIDFANTYETYLSLKSFSVIVCVTEAHLEPCQVCAIEFFPENKWLLLSVKCFRK